MKYINQLRKIFSTPSSQLFNNNKIMQNMKKQNRRGFTLVELMIVIAIIGVLASMIFPALSSVMGKGNQMTATNNARNISSGWLTYSKTGTQQRKLNRPTIHEWAMVLARHAELNDPKIWCLEFDPAVMDKTGSGTPMPVAVANEIGSNWKLNAEFKAFPISWEVANRTDPNVKEPNKRPLVWTRGLKSNGTWDEATGVFKDGGGVMAFADAHVVAYTSLKDDNGEGVLSSYKGGRRTYNVRNAMEPTANILKSKIEAAESADSDE